MRTAMRNNKTKQNKTMTMIMMKRNINTYTHTQYTYIHILWSVITEQTKPIHDNDKRIFILLYIDDRPKQLFIELNTITKNYKLQ